MDHPMEHHSHAWYHVSHQNKNNKKIYSISIEFVDCNTEYKHTLIVKLNRPNNI